jgi:GDP-mannose 6-dehydrogenase
MEIPNGTNTPLHTLQIGIIGLGYVGAVTAACLARLGHKVYGAEHDRGKIAKLKSGLSPFYEPGLDPLLREALDAGLLEVLQTLDPALEELDIIQICVGTPTGSDGAYNRTHLERVCQNLAARLRAGRRTKPLVIAIRSTVTPGTTGNLRARFLADIPDVHFAYIPEFLREGSAIKDFFEPALVVVGADDAAVAELALAPYSAIDAPKRVMPLRAAEMVKGVCNAFHALKAAFANETGTLAAAQGVNPEELMAVICEDRRLNISPAYLKPGFAFGGSCLPKDVRAINNFARTNGISLPLYESILPSNDEHLTRASARVLEAGLKRAGFIGLSFKSQTDDMRESPALRLAARLHGGSMEVRAFDPDIRADMLHGANLEALDEVFGSGKQALAATLDELLAWADGLVLTKTPPADVMEKLRSSGLPVVDVSRIAALASRGRQEEPAVGTSQTA